MLVFYYSKNSSAVSAHILLEEVGAVYQTVEVPIAEGKHKEPAFLSINPKGRIPALAVGDRVITENPAILTFLAEAHAGAGVLPDDPVARARVHEVNAFLSSTAHVAYAHFRRGARWADDPAAIQSMQAKAAQNLRDTARVVEDHYIEGPFVLGPAYSIADPYLFLMHRWLAKVGVDLADYPHLAAHQAAVAARPATQRVLALHNG